MTNISKGSLPASIIDEEKIEQKRQIQSPSGLLLQVSSCPPPSQFPFRSDFVTINIKHQNQGQYYHFNFIFHGLDMLSAKSFPIVPHYCPVPSQAGHLLDVVPARLEGVQADVLDGVLKVTKYLRTIFSIGKQVHSHSM